MDSMLVNKRCRVYTSENNHLRISQTTAAWWGSFDSELELQSSADLSELARSSYAFSSWYHVVLHVALTKIRA